MSFFKKLGGSIKRAARNKIVLGALNSATGGLSGKALSVAKQIGAKVQAGRVAKRQAKSNAMRIAVAASTPLNPQIRDITPSSTGKPKEFWAGALKPRAKKPRAKKTAAKKPRAKKTAAKKPRAKRATTGKKRSVPSGGLDLAAMAKAWRAAGKPGTWRDWIRTNQIRKP